MGWGQLLRNQVAYFSLFALALSIGTLATPVSAYAVVFIDYFLRFNECCSGDPLHGTHASIRTPSTPILVPKDRCIVFRSAAEGWRLDNGQLRLIQAGFVRCRNNANIDGTCATVNSQVKYIEIKDATGYHCYPKGTIDNNVTVKYGVRQATETVTWSAWLDGVQDSHTVAFGYTDRIIEGGEYTGDCASSVDVPTIRYADPIRWHRLDENWSWYSVQTASKHGNNCQYLLNGGPPDSWIITR